MSSSEGSPSGGGPPTVTGRAPALAVTNPSGNRSRVHDRSSAVPDRPARRKQSGAARQPYLAQSRPDFGGQRRVCGRRSGQPPRRFCERPARETSQAEGRRPHRFWLPGFLPAGVHAEGRRAEPRAWGRWRLPAGTGATNLSKLRSLVEVARALQSSLSTNDVLAAVVDAALSVTGAERGFLLLGKDDQLEVSVARDRRGAPLDTSDLGVPRSLINRALRTRRDLLSMTFDPLGADGFRPEMSVADLELRSVVCVPLIQVRTGSTAGNGGHFAQPTPWACCTWTRAKPRPIFRPAIAKFSKPWRSKPPPFSRTRGCSTKNAPSSTWKKS